MTTVPILLLLALAAATPLPPPPPAPAPERSRAEFDFVDSNEDNRVSSSEHEVYTRKLFDEMDSNIDYKLTVQEIMAAEQKFTRHVFTSGNILGPAELSTAEKIQRIDANQDGIISRDEHANAAAAKYIKMDINNNGELSLQEFAAGG